MKKALLIIQFVVLLAFNETNAQQICSGSIKTYKVDLADGVNGSTNSTYNWSVTPSTWSGVLTGNGTNSVVINWGNTPPGTYTINVTENNGTCSGPIVSKTIEIIANPITPTIINSGSLILCNSNVTLSTALDNNLSYQWLFNGSIITNATSNSIVASNPGTYEIRTTNSSGCSSSSSIIVSGPSVVTYNGAWSSPPNASSIVQITSDLILSNDLHVCSCSISNNANVSVLPNKTLKIEGNLAIENGSNLTINDKASLVQVDNNATNSGNATIIKSSNPMQQYDYTYWSSPTSNQSLSVLGDPSLFYEFAPSLNNWSNLSPSAAMETAKGYIARVPNNLNFSTPQSIQVNFNGTPNNGIITKTIERNISSYNLIGNPYPSAINIDQFILDTNNTSLINGTIYLWTHNTLIGPNNPNPGSGVYAYTYDDYAKYNLTGGVAAVSGGQIPTGFVASGQGFFIEARNTLFNGLYNVNFNNAMRVSANNNNFFRTSNNSSLNTSIEKNRFWLSLQNNYGAFNQTLVGYVSGATNDFDNHYDGKTFNSNNSVSIYSIMDNQSYSIQGKSLPFNYNDIIPLGYSCANDGNYSINLDSFDGELINNDIYLIDKLLNTHQNLKLGSYNFNSQIGTFDNRFEVRYNLNSLGGNQYSLNNQFIVYYNNQTLNIVSNENFPINKVIVYDVLGRNLFENLYDSKREVNIYKNFNTDILLVKVYFVDGSTSTKKVITNK